MASGSTRTPSQGRPRAAFSWVYAARTGSVLMAFGAVAGFLAVAGGALAAHALRSRLPPEQIATLGTAIDYQMYHALALLVLGALPRRPLSSPWFARAALCMAAGMVLFCGSLWFIGLGGWHQGGLLAPVGGSLLMLGWILVAVGALQHGRG